MSVFSRHASRQMPLSPARLMANGHRSFHYFAGCMSGSPSNIFKLLPSSDAKQLYEADIRPLVEPRWGRQNHRDFQSERTRMFISGFCAALDFVPVLAKVNRWSAAYMPGQIDVTSPPESYLKMREFPGAITPPQTVDTTIFKMAKLVAAKLQATGMSGTRNTDDGNMTYPTSIYHSLASLLAPVYSEFTGQICWRHPDASGSYYPESAMAHHLQSFFTGLLGTGRPVLMSCEVEYPCNKGWNFFRIIRGVADLAICMRTDRECGFQSETHAITSLVGERKSDPSIGSACAAFVQVMQYMTTDTVIDNMQAIADKFPGLTPWTVAMIGTGVTNFQMFAISLPVLKRIRHHLDVCTMAGKKLPVLVLSSASTLPVLPPNRVLVSDADPFMGPKQLVDFVQLASWIGSPISQWGGVGGTECEAKVRKVLDASSTV